MTENAVEQLRDADKPELLELLTQAFQEHPLIPALGVKPEATRPVMKAFLDCFGGTSESLLYGIHQDNKLVCASLSLDSAIEPSPPALTRLIFSLHQILGQRVVKEFALVVKEEPKYEDHYLELVILGTLPAYQKQGLGRKMLHFLYDEARGRDYKGLTLVADCNSHAFQLYVREEFIVDKELTIEGTTLCWMRKVTSPTGDVLKK